MTGGQCGTATRKQCGLVTTVYASRIPLRPLAGQRLEAAGQQLEVWKAPLALGSAKLLLESSWRRP